MKGIGIISFILVPLFLILSSCNNSSPTAPVAKPAAPTLSAPANEATDQPTTMTLTWSTVSNATSYHIQVSSSNTFSPVFTEDSSLTTATATVHGLVNGTTYYWRVRAKNAGGVSDWTDAWHFTVIKAGPGAPTPISPANEATYQLWFSTKLTWLPVAGAITYDFQISRNSTFDSLITEDSLLTATGDTLQVYLTGSTAYYWRVRAKNADGAGDWSATWSFTTTTHFQGIWEGTRKVNQNIWRYIFRNDTVRIFTLTYNFMNDVMDTSLTYQGLFTSDFPDTSIKMQNFTIQLMDANFAPTGQTIQTLYHWIGGVGSFIQFEMMENDPDAPRPVDMSDLNKKIVYYFKDY